MARFGQYVRKRKALITIFALLALAIVGGLSISRYTIARLPTYDQIESSSTVDDSQLHVDASQHLENYASLAYVFVAICLLLASGVAVVHAGRNPAVMRWREKAFAVSAISSGERLFVAFALGALFVLAGLLIARANSHNYFPARDEISYLEVAVRAKSQFGASGFPLALYSGQWGEHDKQPLYISMLLPFASQSLGFFVNARLASTVIATATLLVVLFVSWRFFGPVPALVTTALFGLSMDFVASSSSISATPLFTALFLLSVYLTITGFEKPYAIPAGAFFAGLAYMTLLAGILLPVAFLASALIRWRLSAFRRRSFYLYFLVFLVVASPLLVRNIVRFGNPVSNRKFSHLWLDARAATDTVEYIEGRTGIVSYIRSHDLLNTATGLLEGCERTARIAASTASPIGDAGVGLTRGERPYPVGVVVGWIVLLGALCIALLDTNRDRRAFVIAFAAVVFLATSAYSKIALTPGSVLPYMPLVYGYFSAGVVSLWFNAKYRSAILVAVCCLSFWSGAERLDTLALFRMRHPSREAVMLADWLEYNVKRGEVYLIGPDDGLNFAWYRRIPGQQRDVPNTPDLPSLIRAANRFSARYVVISKTLYGSRMLQFSNSFRLEGASLVAPPAVDGWRPVFFDPFGDVDYIVFELVPEDSTLEEEPNAHGD